MYPRLKLTALDDSRQIEGYLSTDDLDTPRIKLSKFEANRQKVIKKAKEHLADADHDHDSQSEEESVIEVDTKIEEVVYLTGEKCNMSNDVFSQTIAANILTHLCTVKTNSN